MDDNAKNIASYQLDQEILDARGINMTVEEVAGLSTCKYSERVQSLRLSTSDLAFLKGLRRRIKNRLASQNSRRRSVEHLRRLTRELRAVRACRRDALVERRALVLRRDDVRDKCASLRRHLVQILTERLDNSEVPSIEVTLPESHSRRINIISTNTPDHSKYLRTYSVIKKTSRNNRDDVRDIDTDIYGRVRHELESEKDMESDDIETLIIKEEVSDYEDDLESEQHYESNGFERDELERGDFERDELQSSDLEKGRVTFNGQNNGLFKIDNSFPRETITFEIGDHYDSEEEREKEAYESEKRNVLNSNANTDIFECQIGKLVQQSVNHLFKEDKKKVFAKTVFISNEMSSNIRSVVLADDDASEVLNLSVKEGRRKSHGRKQSAPRRVAYYSDCDDGVLDLKMKKEPQ